MKRILILLGLMAATSLGMQAENRTVTDTVDGKKRVIELQDTVINGQQTTDTLSITTYEGTDADEAGHDDTYGHRHNGGGLQWVGFNFGDDAPETVIALTAIIFTLGLPAMLIFIIFYFRYKNRKAKYRLAEQALAAGQQLPPEFFKEGEGKDLRSRGIKNIFLGIGLFIFLWAITGVFGLGCIGLLIMFTGFGQVAIYYTQPGQGDGKPFIRMERDEKKGYRYMKVGGIELRDQTEKTEKKDTPAAEDTNEPKE
ncbi:DUF6249 domain-containing protein [Mediterranea massiliensis]|uniref:DUF6249 domain-containing protein n=1 Tax=Mediterranea massiliensis TaxID=1841865 RepID=UPI0023F4D2E5|nr:DUF6249 domain-containing protein [Mediterranea massiliensis]